MTHPLSRNTGELAVVSISFAIDAQTDIEGFDGLSPEEVKDALEDIKHALHTPEILTQAARAAWNTISQHANQTGLLSYGEYSEATEIDTGEHYRRMTDTSPDRAQLPTEEQRITDRIRWQNRSRIALNLPPVIPRKQEPAAMPPTPESLH